MNNFWFGVQDIWSFVWSNTINKTIEYKIESNKR